MKHTLLNLMTLMIALAGSAFGQATTTSTTLSTAINTTVLRWCLASGTGVNAPSISRNGSYLAADQEAVQVLSTAGGTNCYNVRRGQLGSALSTHLSGTTVWVGDAATSTGDPSRPFTGGPFVANIPSGNCTASQQQTLPIIVFSGTQPWTNGSVLTCSTASYWGKISALYVPPTSCTFAPTTLTVTNTYPQVGASTIFVLNGVTNAAAGTLTLTCNVSVPVNVTLAQSTFLLDITLFVGSQVVAPTSLGTSTLGSITFPVAIAGSETASVVTPVAIGGTVTTVSPSNITTVTTAGAFLTIKHTYATQVKLSDRQLLQYTMPFVQSAASAMTINTPGLLVHYLIPTALL